MSNETSFSISCNWHHLIPILYTGRLAGRCRHAELSYVRHCAPEIVELQEGIRDGGWVRRQHGQKYKIKWYTWGNHILRIINCYVIIHFDAELSVGCFQGCQYSKFWKISGVFFVSNYFHHLYILQPIFLWNCRQVMDIGKMVKIKAQSPFTIMKFNYYLPYCIISIHSTN